MTRLFYIVFFRRRYLAIKHLDDDVNAVKKFQRQSKYEVGSAEWNPSDLNCHLCAISVRFYISFISIIYCQQKLYYLREKISILSYFILKTL